MKFKRNIYQDLLAWKNEINHQPLMVVGQSQVGKTFIIREFANQEYQKVIELNFLDQPKYKQYFESNLNFEDLLRAWINDFQLDYNQLDRYLFFFDEIQACPMAIEALKMINESETKINLICAGKYLNFQNKPISWPVGQYKTIKMKQMMFDEFIDAVGRKQMLNLAINAIKSKQTINLVVHQELLKWFDFYVKIGGFPQVVATFIQSQFNYHQALNVCLQIAKNYLLDLYEYSEIFMNKKALVTIYKSIPNHLTNKSHKFIFQNLDLVNCKFRDLEKYLFWLWSEGLAIKINNVSSLKYPLIHHDLDNHFKLYYNDHGLFTINANLDFNTYSTNIQDLQQGLYESFVISQLHFQFSKIYYYAWIHQGLKHEVDFVVANLQNETCLISVNKNYQALGRKQIKTSPYKFRLSTDNYQVFSTHINIPIYFAFMLKDLI